MKTKIQRSVLQSASVTHPSWMVVSSRVAWIGTVLAVVSFSSFTETVAQPAQRLEPRGLQINRQPAAQNVVPNALIDDLEMAGLELPVQTLSNGGATLKTDPELESLLEKAKRYQEDGNFRVATRFWQAVLERSGDALFSENDKTYFSLARRVEQILAELPPEGLASYRVTADANAKEILAAAGDPFDVLALSKIVRQYFISSQGDDAALTLSSIYLDRLDFIGAYRLLQKIATQYPEPSVSLQEVHLKLAFCETHFGNTSAATTHLARAQQLSGGGDENAVQTFIDSIDEFDISTSGLTAQNTNSFGDSRQFGVAPSVPPSAFSNRLKSVWQYYFEPSKQSNWSDYKTPNVIASDISSVKATVSNVEKSLIGSWRAKSWQPTGNLLFENDKVFFKTPVDTIAWDANVDARTADVAWRPVRRNAFVIDDITLLEIRRRRDRRRQLVQGNRKSSGPSATNEIQLFGDRIASQMCIFDGVLYTIEGPSFDQRAQLATSSPLNSWNTTPRRSRSNFLTAYDADSGLILWSLPRLEEIKAEDVSTTMPENVESDFLQSGGFMAAPIHYRGLIIAPVNQGGTISIYAFDPTQNGRTVWSAYLCDEPEAGSQPWAAINLSIDGSDLFATCGYGVFFVLDPSTGMVRFAKRYQRQGVPHKLFRQFGRNMNYLQFNGWSSDTIVPYGRQFICFRSDTNDIESYDRITGNLIWRSTMQPLDQKVDYILGVHDGILYAAGTETIIAYELDADGRMVLGGSPLFDGKKSYGRGILTSDAIYMPVEKTIVKIALKSKTDRPVLLATAQVETGFDAPIGNLFSDGKKIWVHGANRLYALGPSNQTKIEN